MGATGQAGLEVADHGVDPLELRQILWFAPADHRGPVRAIGLGNRCKTGQAVGRYDATRGQRGFGPLRDGVQAEAGDRGELGALRMTVIAERDGCDERGLILRTAARLAPLSSPPK